MLYAVWHKPHLTAADSRAMLGPQLRLLHAKNTQQMNECKTCFELSKNGTLQSYSPQGTKCWGPLAVQKHPKPLMQYHGCDAFQEGLPCTI